MAPPPGWPWSAPGSIRTWRGAVVQNVGPMGEPGAQQRGEIVPLEPRRLGLGEVFYLTREAVVVADASSGRIVLWNDGAAQLFGHEQDQAIGLLVEDLVP